VNKNLHGYCIKSNHKKPKIYIIRKTTDPTPPQYDTAFYLRDVYQEIKDYQKKFPLISNIDPEFEKKIQYNSQWVIYKIPVPKNNP
jgi:hypothetical protein